MIKWDGVCRSRPQHRCGTGLRGLSSGSALHRERSGDACSQRVVGFMKMSWLSTLTSSSLPAALGTMREKAGVWGTQRREPVVRGFLFLLSHFPEEKCCSCFWKKKKNFWDENLIFVFLLRVDWLDFSLKQCLYFIHQSLENYLPLEGGTEDWRSGESDVGTENLFRHVGFHENSISKGLG